MYTIEFYENAHGKSELWDFLELLRTKIKTSKDARIQYNQIVLYIQLLQDNGTRLPKDVTKHIEDGIWELRPEITAYFISFFENNTFVLLHQFRKKHKNTTQKLKKQNLNAVIIYPERSVLNMRTWNDYKEHVREVDPIAANDINEIENIASIVGALIEQRTALGISQRELASLCGIPQSSVARIESYKSTPNLDTLLKIMQPLGLKLTVSPTK